MKGTEKQIAFANDIIKEWREHAAKKRAFFESKGPIGKLTTTSCWTKEVGYVA